MTIWLGSADPWWRPKEWAALILGSGWLMLKPAWNQRPLRSGQDRFLCVLLIAFLIHFSVKFIFPVVQAPGLLTQSPWPWLAFLHVLVAVAWITDVRRLIRLIDVQFLVKVMAWLGVALSLYMIAQKLNLDPVMRYVQWRYKGFVWLDPNHVIGLLGSPFQAAASLAVLVPAISYQSFHAKHKTMWRVLLILSLYSCWITDSISSLVAASIGSLAASRKIQTWRLLGLALFLGLCFLAALQYFYPNTLLEHGRLSMWKQAFSHFIQHPFLGVGFSQFKELGVTLFIGGNHYACRWAHSEWVQFSTELGLIVSGLLFSYLLKEWVKLYRVHLGMFGCMASVLFLSLFHIPFHLTPTLVITWLFLVSTHIEPLRS